MIKNINNKIYNFDTLVLIMLPKSNGVLGKFLLNSMISYCNLKPLECEKKDIKIYNKV